MKQAIHPKYYPNATFTCACGNVVIAGSTIEAQKTDICSKCHPFYTGKHKLVDTAGRVDKFKARQKKAQEMQQKNDKDKTDESKTDKSDEKYLTVKDIKTLKEKTPKKSTKVAKKPAEKPSAKKAKTA